MAEDFEKIVQQIKNKWQGNSNPTSNMRKLVSASSIDASQPIDLLDYSIGGRENFSTDRNGKIIANFSSYLGNTGNEDRLAKDQAWYGDLGRGLTKFLGKTVINAMDNIASYTYGIYNGIKEGSLNAVFDNDVTAWFDDQAKRLDTKFATYYTDEEKSQSALGKLFTFSYFVDGVSNGASFIAGSLLPEVALGVLTGGASMPASMAKYGAKLGLKGLAKSTDNLATSTIKNAGEKLAEQTAKNITRESGKKAIRALNRNTAMGNWAGESLKTVGFLTRSSMFEAGMEARHNLHDSVDNFMYDYQNKYGTLPSQAELNEFIKEAGSQANGVFWGNMAILSVSNAAMFGKMLNLKPIANAVGLGGVGKSVSKGWDKIIGLSVDTLADGTKVMSKANKLQKIIGYSAPVVGKIASEGVFEEGGQGILGKAMQNYLNGKYVNNDATMTYFDAFKKGVEEQFTTSDGGFEILMGGVIGLLGGNVSAMVGKGASAVGVKGFENASFGVAGMFGDSYGAQVKRMTNLASSYNDSLKSFRNTNRMNSLIAHSNENTAEADVFNDTLQNYSFIRTSEQFKDVSDTIADFNVAVDNLVFDPKEMREQGIDSAQVESYKQSLKEKFKKDYDSYEKSKKIVDRLEFNNTGLSEGNLTELKDALTFSLMSADTAGDKATNIAEQITNLTNGTTDVNVIKFFENLDNKNKELAQEYTEKQKEKNELTQKLAEIGATIETAKDSEARMKQLSKQREGAIKRMLELDNEIVQVENELKERLTTASYEGMKNSVPTTESVASVVDSYNALNDYISVLERTGKKQEANDIKFLLNQYKKFNTVYLDGQNTISRMMATDFFSKNKPFLSRILGESYSPSDKFKQVLEEREEAIAEILTDFGYDVTKAPDTLIELLKNSETLSDREKYQIESVIKTIAMRNRVDAILNEAEDILIVEQEVPSNEVVGDRISRVNLPENLDNVEQLNNIIKQISEQIDQITNTPSREALQEIKKLRKELAQKEQELLDLQNGKLPTSITKVEENAIQEQETTSVLQREQEEIGETGSERGRVEQEFEREEFTEEEIQEAINFVEGLTEEEVANEVGQLEILFPENEQEEQDTIEGGISDNNDVEVTNNVSGTNQEDEAGATVSTSNDDNQTNAGQSPEDIQNENDRRENRLTEDIERLRKSIEDLETPFKFLESEGYKRYLKLLDEKVNNPENVNEEELSQLESDMDNWFAILGTDVNEEFHLSDLVKQMVALENMEVPPTDNVDVVTEEEIDQDIKFADKFQDNFFAVGINTAVGVSKVVNIEGVNYFEVANISLEGLLEKAGIELSEDDYTVLPDTNSIRLTVEAVERINAEGNIRILVPDFDSNSTNYDTIKVREVGMDGNSTLNTLKTDFTDAVDDNLAYNIKPGDKLRVSVSRDSDWNDELFEKVEQAILGNISNEELEKRSTPKLQILISKSKSYQNKANKLRILKSAKSITTTDRAKINKLEKELKEEELKLKEKAEEQVLDEISKNISDEISDELKKELISKLRIDLVDSEGNSVQTLKGTRPNQSKKAEGNKSELEALRTIVVNNKDMLLNLADLGRGGKEILEIEVPIEEVYPGLPNNYMNDNNGTISREYRLIESKHTNDIVDTGYVQNGKLVLRNGTELTSDSFIRSAKNSNSPTKKPVIVIQKGEQKIAYPIRIASDTIDVDLNEFSAIYNNPELTPTEKALRLNQIVASAGIDVKLPGNSFIVLGNNLSEEVYNNLFGRLENISYLRSVEPLVDKSVSISDALISVGASTSLNLSDPFSGAKFKLDLKSFKQEDAKLTEQDEKVIDTHSDFESNTTSAGIRRIKNDCY